MTDEAEFEALYETHADDLLRFALRRVREPADAADVVAQTWAVAWRKRKTAPSGPEQRLWLFGVARKVLANQNRGRLRESALTQRLREELALRERPTHAEYPHVEQALAGLAVKDAELLVMLAWDDLTPEQIAVVLGISPGAARVRIHRARSRFRAELQRRGIAVAHNETGALHCLEETS